MAVEEHDGILRLRRAFEAYLHGETPSPLELAQAPLLVNWRVVIVQIKDTDPLRLLPLLVGSVTRHPQHGDIPAIRTSQLVWIDRNRRWARTWNRVYRLGNHAGGEVGSESEVEA